MHSEIFKLEISVLFLGRNKTKISNELRVVYDYIIL